MARPRLSNGDLGNRRLWGLLGAPRGNSSDEVHQPALAGKLGFVRIWMGIFSSIAFAAAFVMMTVLLQPVPQPVHFPLQPHVDGRGRLVIVHEPLIGSVVFHRIATQLHVDGTGGFVVGQELSRAFDFVRQLSTQVISLSTQIVQ
jgi:hypothetical protein